MKYVYLINFFLLFLFICLVCFFVNFPKKLNLKNNFSLNKDYFLPHQPHKSSTLKKTKEKEITEKSTINKNELPQEIIKNVDHKKIINDLKILLEKSYQKIENLTFKIINLKKKMANQTNQSCDHFIDQINPLVNTKTLYFKQINHDLENLITFLNDFKKEGRVYQITSYPNNVQMPPLINYQNWNQDEIQLINVTLTSLKEIKKQFNSYLHEFTIKDFFNLNNNLIKCENFIENMSLNEISNCPIIRNYHLIRVERFKKLLIETKEFVKKIPI